MKAGRPQHPLEFRRYPILYVDDEAENLRIFEISFRREFSILTARSAEEGLRLLASEPVAVVLSDQRMPGMSGTVFMSHVRELVPATVRILITAYGDVETLTHAINHGAIYRYIAKPWSPEEVAQTLRGAIELYAEARERESLSAKLEGLALLSKGLSEKAWGESLVQNALDSLTRRLGFDGACLLRADEAGRQLQISHQSPSKGPVAEELSDFSLERAEVPEFIQRVCDGEPQILHFEKSEIYEPRIREWLAAVVAQQILVAPLRSRRGMLGALAVDNRSGGRFFTALDRQLLSGLAALLAIALENQRLLEGVALTAAEGDAEREHLASVGGMSVCLAQDLARPLSFALDFVTEAPARRGEESTDFWETEHETAKRHLDEVQAVFRIIASLARDAKPGATGRHCDLAHEVRSELENLEPEIRQSGVDLQLLLAPAAPKITILSEHFRQVFRMLLRNALRATPVGEPVRVELRGEVTERGEGALLTVMDSGASAELEDLGARFGPASLAETDATAAQSRLAACQYLVAVQGGSIQVQSEPDRGTCLRVWLPAEPPSATEETPPRASG